MSNQLDKTDGGINMFCSCGDSIMLERKVQKDKKIIGEYNLCKGCGRIHWTKPLPEWVDTSKLRTSGIPKNK